MKSLEEDVERSIAREEAMLSGENPPSPSTPSLDDIQALQRSYKELKTKYEVCKVPPCSAYSADNGYRLRSSSFARGLQMSR